MKKTYNKPTTQIYTIQTIQVLANSIRVNKGENVDDGWVKEENGIGIQWGEEQNFENV